MDLDLYQAIVDDDCEKLSSVLNDGGDPDAWLEDVVRRSGKSMLHVCCEKGRYSCVKVQVLLFSCVNLFHKTFM